MNLTDDEQARLDHELDHLGEYIQDRIDEGANGRDVFAAITMTAVELQTAMRGTMQ